jgi:hypothetical protein
VARQYGSVHLVLPEVRAINLSGVWFVHGVPITTGYILAFDRPVPAGRFIRCLLFQVRLKMIQRRKR